jgi:hypothetical protein
MSFAGNLRRFGRETMEKHTKVKRMAALELFGDIIERTPVDTGRLRSNWFANVGRGSRETTTATTGATERMRAALAGRLDADIFFTNNLPYANRIEFDGHSRIQAPNGMVRISVLRWGSIVKKSAKRVARGG